MWELDFGRWASTIHSPEASAPDPFFGGSNSAQVELKPEVPQLREDLKFYWAAWQDLKSERPSIDGVIPWRAIKDYAQMYCADLFLLKVIVWEVDQVFISAQLDKIKNSKGAKQDG